MKKISEYLKTKVQLLYPKRAYIPGLDYLANPLRLWKLSIIFNIFYIKEVCFVFILDDEEEQKKLELREVAKKELEEWYRNHKEAIAKTKAANR